MEIGADAVLVNTAIAVAGDPVNIAKAFKMAVEAGYIAYKSKLPKTRNIAEASSLLTLFSNYYYEFYGSFQFNIAGLMLKEPFLIKHFAI